jgi:hypothetical protein
MTSFNQNGTNITIKATNGNLISITLIYLQLLKNIFFINL